MGVKERLNYWRRVGAAYLLPSRSQLTFWHETPEVNDRATTQELGEYYMTFAAKADYAGPFDERGIPLLDYRGTLGLQYNPIAIAQYGLANFNADTRDGSSRRLGKVRGTADWLVHNLETNKAGLHVWNHHFDWEYRTKLRAPWYSALAQGQGISLLVRAHKLLGDPSYLKVATSAFQAFLSDVSKGGVVYVDAMGRPWLEEYIVDPPTHVLNGFIWATWGVYDYYLATGDVAARQLFEGSIETLEKNLHLYDAGFWSLYELAGTRMRMLASPFYHSLHIVQLEVLMQLTGEQLFGHYAEQWRAYQKSSPKKTRALIQKVAFKLIHY